MMRDRQRLKLLVLGGVDSGKSSFLRRVCHLAAYARDAIITEGVDPEEGISLRVDIADLGFVAEPSAASGEKKVTLAPKKRETRTFWSRFASSRSTEEATASGQDARSESNSDGTTNSSVSICLQEISSRLDPEELVRLLRRQPCDGAVVLADATSFNSFDAGDQMRAALNASNVDPMAVPLMLLLSRGDMTDALPGIEKEDAAKAVQSCGYRIWTHADCRYYDGLTTANEDGGDDFAVAAMEQWLSLAIAAKLTEPPKRTSSVKVLLGVDNVPEDLKPLLPDEASDVVPLSVFFS
ncbi:MAG: hypothetical protein MHM6MM_000342 [Cercozoa sp. M6MM]